MFVSHGLDRKYKKLEWIVEIQNYAHLLNWIMNASCRDNLQMFSFLVPNKYEKGGSSGYFSANLLFYPLVEAMALC